MYFNKIDFFLHILDYLLSSFEMNTIVLKLKTFRNYFNVLIPKFCYGM